VNAKLIRADPSSPGQLQEGETKSLSLIILGLFFIIHLLYAFWGPMNIMEGGLLGTDGYTRLNRVQFIYEQGTWNNSILPRSNAPYGESIHWTKPMDFLLLAGAGVFSMFLPYSTGLHLWGVIISPLLHILTFVGLFCLMRQHLDRLGMILLAILFHLPPILTGYFMVGRPDHHSLILAIFAWFLVGLNWGLENPRNLRHFILVGCLGALGVWVSVEFFVPIGFFLSAYTLVWMWRGKSKIYPILIIISSMFVFSALFLFLERFGEDPFSIEYDRISLPHVIVLGLILVVWVGLSLLSRRTTWLSTIWGRIGAIGIGSTIACLVQWNLFPGFFLGPLAGMDPAIRQLWDNVAETQPLQISAAIMNLGMGILVLPWLAMGMWRDQVMLSKYQGLLLLIGAGVFIPLALYELRWTPYASILLLIPYVAYVRRALEWVETRWLKKRSEAVSLFFGLVLLFWPITVGTVLALEEPQGEISTIGGKCPLLPLTEYLNVEVVNQRPSKTILAFKDFGPELLYRTSHQVIGTPMHRNREGFGDSLDIMKAQNPLHAKAILQRRHVDLVVICLNSKAELDTYGDSIPSPNFYETLRKGVLPTWLREIVLPEKLQESFRLFEVEKSEMFPDS